MYTAAPAPPQSFTLSVPPSVTVVSFLGCTGLGSHPLPRTEVPSSGSHEGPLSSATGPESWGAIEKVATMCQSCATDGSARSHQTTHSWDSSSLGQAQPSEAKGQQWTWMGGWPALPVWPNPQCWHGPGSSHSRSWGRDGSCAPLCWAGPHRALPGLFPLPRLRLQALLSSCTC